MAYFRCLITQVACDEGDKCIGAFCYLTKPNNFAEWMARKHPAPKPEFAGWLSWDGDSGSEEYQRP
jgi:hypothetical protein